MPPLTQYQINSLERDTIAPCLFSLERKTMEKENRGKARYGPQRRQYEINRDRVLKEQTVCGICGRPVDKRLRYPHPLSATVDHIIPLKRGGHPSDIDNLQLAHWTCNRQKSDKLIDRPKFEENSAAISNRVLPHSIDWKHFHDLVI